VKTTKPPAKKPVPAKKAQEVPAPAYVEPTPEQIAAEIKVNRMADAEDLFGFNEKKEIRTRKLDEKLDQLAVSTDDDYRAFAANIAGRIEVEKRGNTKRLMFLRELLKAASGPLSLEEVNELKSTVNVIFNEKKKKATSKKPKKKSGKSIKVGGLEDDYEEETTFTAEEY
jgi:hypothetical protein